MAEKIKYITFDCYGTLIDWKKGIEENFSKYFSSSVRNEDIFSRYVTIEAREESNYKPYIQVLAETSILLADSLGIRVSEDDSRGPLFASSITQWPPFPDTFNALKELGDLGYTRVILSNVDTELLKKTIENNLLEVDSFITAQQIGSYKPAEKHWLEFFERYGAEKGETIHVAGSMYHDIIPARKLGLKTVWVNRYGKKEQPTSNDPDWTVSSLSEVSTILSNRLR